jgi:hypothetical protein
MLAGDTNMWRALPAHVQVTERVAVRDPHSRTNFYETYPKAYYDEYSDPLPIRDCPAQSDAGRDPEPGRTCLHKIPWVPIVGVGGPS